MKFCLIGPIWPYRGGIAHNSAIIAKSVVEAGHNISILSFRHQYPKWLYPGQTDQDNSQYPLKTNAEYILAPFSPLSWKRTADLAISYQPDLVIIQWWTFFWAIPFAYLSRYIISRKYRVAYSIHNVASHETHVLDNFFTRLALNPAENYLVYSENEKEKLIKLYPNKKIVQTHLPVYSFNNSGNMSSEAARKSLNLPDDGSILLFFGFVRPYKGLSFLLQAMHILKKQGIAPYLAIAGEFWGDKDAYLGQIKQYGLESQIRIEDRYIPNEEADLWFRAADVLVAPYTKGVTQSAVASLGLGYGIPMIVTQQVVEGMETRDDQKVFSVPPDDAEALANQIGDFIKSSKTISEPVVPKFNNDQLVQSLIELSTSRIG